MSDDTYDDILNKSFDDLPEDQLLPSGYWVLKLRNAAIMPPKAEGQSGRVLFFYTPVEPTDDVDVSDLGDYDYTENQIVFQVWIEGNRSWKDVLRHLKKHAGVDFKVGTIGDVMKKGIKGAEIVAELGERTYENSFGEMNTENTASNFRPVD